MGSNAPPMGLVVQIVSMVLASLGLFSLFTLLFTIALVEEVSRHPIFLNFICIWALWSVFVAFSALTAIALPAYDQVETSRIMYCTMRDMLCVATQVATLNLVIHLWFTVRTALHGPSSSRAVKLRSLALLVTPYLIGILPIAELFYPPGVIFGAPTRQFAEPLFLTLAIGTFLFDGALLLVFWRNGHISRQSGIHEVMSLQLVARILIFSLSRLIFVIFYVVSITSDTPSNVPAILVQIGESLNPLFVFSILGVKPDTLRAWFRKSGQIHDIESDIGGTTINLEDNSGSNRSHCDITGTPVSINQALSREYPSHSAEFGRPSTSRPTLDTPR